ncbi:MAG: glycoside hydrolase family 5 protein [Treponema sp.]|nr:glycoside hydrolase family 5 protein [Treponema sp.]
MAISTAGALGTDTGTGEAPPRALPFSKGVNFTKWFEAPSPGAIIFSRFTEQDFIDAKSIGVEVIRLPVKMHAMTGGPPSYALDPLFLDLLDRAVGWAEKHGLYLILDNHSFHPVEPTAPDIDTILVPVWTQMAGRYRDRSGYILYEVLNEPHGIDGKKWAAIQDRVVKAIREIDPERGVIIGGTNYNSIDALSDLPSYTDNVIYTFHFYDPYLFTHQGETWGSPPNLKTLKGMPFPADAHAVPEIPPELKGTWVENSIRSSYRTDATVQALAKNLDKAVQFSRSRGGLPLFCGEFGAYLLNSLNEDRVRWYRAAAGLLDERGIARASWDYYGGFGLFKTEDGGSFESGLNVEIVEAMGFAALPQKNR